MSDCRLGAIRPFLYPVAVAVSAVTTLTTPWLIRAAGPIAAYVDRKLPRNLQTYAALYGSWVARLGTNPAPRTGAARIRRLVIFLLVDIAAIASTVIVTALAMPRALRFAQALPWAHGHELVHHGLIGVAILLAAPFALGAGRVAHALATKLAAEALPETGGVDLSAAPRRALVVTIQIAVLLAAGLPLLAVTQPFLPSVPGLVLLLALVGLLVAALLHSARGLNEHVRAGAQVVLERLAAESRESTTPSAPSEPTMRAVLDGIGAATAVRLAGGSPAIGRTLKQLQLRGRTSATVVVIDCRPTGVVYPTGDEPLAVDDVLVLTGSREAVEAAEALLAA